MDKRYNIAFSDTINYEFERSSSLENKISIYYELFNNVIDALLKIPNLEDSNNITASKDITLLIHAYEEVIHEAVPLFTQNRIKIKGVNFSFFFTKADFFNEQWKKKDTDILLSFVLLSKVVIGTISVLHEFFACKGNDTSFVFVKRGYEILGITWFQYFKQIYNGIDAAKNGFFNLLLHTISNGFKNSRIFSSLNPELKRSVSYADYPYKFRTSISKLVIKNINVTSPYLANIYNVHNCALTFNQSIGISAALFENTNNHEICLSFAGTRFSSFIIGVQNLKTDLVQILFGPDATYAAAVGLLDEVQKDIKAETLLVVGHSLGGGLMQFSIAAVGKDATRGIGFNSAGLSKRSWKLAKDCKKKNYGTDANHSEIKHICSTSDFVSIFGRFYGTKEYVNTGYIVSHSLEHLIQKISKGVLVCLSTKPATPTP